MKGFIYKVTNILNKKVYIGQTTRTIEERWSEHCRNAFEDNNLEYKNKFHRAIRKYGIGGFICKLEDSVESNTLEELKEILNKKEIYYIAKYNSKDDGYNSTFGGDINPMFGVRGKDNVCSKKVNQYTLEGVYIKTWFSFADIHRELGIDSTNVIRVCNKSIKNRVSAGGYIWKYFSEYPNTDNITLTKEELYYLNESPRKTAYKTREVAQYTLQGEFIQKFESLSAAAKSIDGYASAICNVCKGVDKTSKGYIWKYI